MLPDSALYLVICEDAGRRFFKHVVQHLPQWHKKLFGPCSFVVFPHVKQPGRAKPSGLDLGPNLRQPEALATIGQHLDPKPSNGVMSRKLLTAGNIKLSHTL